MMTESYNKQLPEFKTIPNPSHLGGCGGDGVLMCMARNNAQLCDALPPCFDKSGNGPRHLIHVAVKVKND